MAKLDYIIEIDATLIVEAYKKGLTDGFALAVETKELDEQLNLLGIEEAPN